MKEKAILVLPMRVMLLRRRKIVNLAGEVVNS
jgi:hypothetical protein